MTTYYRATTPVTGNDGKTRFREIGVAFPQKEGSKSAMKIILEALPLNGEIILFAPRADGRDDQDDDTGR